MFSCLQILEAFLWFVLITLLNVTLIILTLSVSRLLNLLLRLVAFLLFLNPQCLASISRWITASSSWKRFCLFVCRALTLALVRFPPTATKEIQYLNAKGALTYTDIAGDPVLYGNLPPREISMKDVFRSGDSSKKFKI